MEVTAGAAARQGLAFTLGTMLLRREHWWPAAILLRRAAARAPDHWEAHNNLAVALLKLERWEDAARAAERAVSLNPAAADSHDFLGIALLRLERLEEAVVAYRRAIEVDPGRYDSYDRLGIVLWRLKRWAKVVETYEAALTLDAGRHPAHHRLGIAQLRLKRWDAAAAAFRRAIELATADPAAAAELAGLQRNLSIAVAQGDAAKEAEAAALAAPEAHLRRGAAFLADSKWDEALAELAQGSRLSPDVGALHYLQVDPLVRLGRFREAVVAHQRAGAVGGPKPRLPGPAAATRFEQRRTAFWTSGNLGPDVFAVERWLTQLASVLDRMSPGPRLLFALDNDFGELATVRFFVLGQDLAARSTLLLPERLYVHNRDAIPGRTEQFGSVDDIVRVADRERPEIVFLCSGYLFGPHLQFTPEELGRLLERLRERGCRVVTADPFLGMLSKQAPRTLIRFAVSRDHATKLAALPGLSGAVHEMSQSRADAEEQTWAWFTRSEGILRNIHHLYPSYCAVAEDDVAETDARNVAFFNDRLLRPAPAIREGAAQPHWLFILGTADCETQAVLEAGAFVDIVASKLVEALAAGRHPVLIAPTAFIDDLMPHMPTAEGIDLVSQCPFTRFYSLLLSAEHAFYWNVVSHSLLIRLYNQLPIVQFDRGHLVRSVPAIYHRIVGWYYQGWEPPLRNHRETLTLETVEAWSAEYRQQAARLVERYRRAPSPEAMIADLMSRAGVA